MLREKFNSVQNDCKELWNTRRHQPDSTGNTSEGNQVVYLKAFFKLFEFLNESSTNAAEENTCCTNVTINRSLIGQQALLSSRRDGQLLSTVANPNRVRGNGNVAQRITMNIEEEEQVATITNKRDNNSNDQNTSSSSSTQVLRMSPPTLSRRLNFCQNMNLPPSACAIPGVDVGMMHNHFNSIAGSLNTLTMSNRICGVNDINNEIINT